MTGEGVGHKLRRLRDVVFLFGTLCLFIAMIFLTGERLKDEATRVWQTQAQREAEGITNEGMAWLQLFQSDLRSLATIFHASDSVDEVEFLDALALIEDRDVATPVVAWGMAEVIYHNETDRAPSYRIALSSENEGLLSNGHDLSVIMEMRETAREALQSDGRVITGRTYVDRNGDRQILFAIAAPFNGQDGVLFSSINLDDFFKDLEALHVPRGLSLQLAELMKTQFGREFGTPILGSARDVSSSGYTFDFLTQSGGVHWRFTWALAPAYRGGPALALGRFVQWGGSAIAILLFGLFVHLSRENLRVNRLVQARTSALKAALAETERANLQLQQISRIDSLTGLPNRRNMDDFLAREWAAAQREQSNFAIAIVDIDFFKAYNDTLGHLAGDECLKEVALLMKSTILRPNDLIARYGGEEFLCVLPGADKAGIETICQRLRAAVADAELPHPDSPISPYVSISVGAACCVATPGKKVDGLIEAADRLLYEAKETGRDRYRAACLCGTEENGW